MATSGLSSGRIDIGSVVSRGFDTLRRQIRPFLALSIVLAGLPVLVLQYLLGDGSGSADFDVGSLSWLITMITGYVLQAALMRSSILDQNGQPAEIEESIAVAIRLLLPMIGIAILTWILVIVGMVLLIVPGVIAYLMLIVAVPCLVEERRGVTESMRRSRELTKGSRGMILLLVILFSIFYFAVEGFVGVVTGIFGGDSDLGTAIEAGLVSALTAMFMAVMLASLYIELRTVKEGATTDSLAAIFE